MLLPDAGGRESILPVLAGRVAKRRPGGGGVREVGDGLQEPDALTTGRAGSGECGETVTDITG